MTSQKDDVDVSGFFGLELGLAIIGSGHGLLVTFELRAIPWLLHSAIMSDAIRPFEVAQFGERFD
jgi:hypothetical protein